MNKKEYEKRMKEIEEYEQGGKRNRNKNNKLTNPDQVTDEEIDAMVAKAEKIRESGEIERKEQEEQKEHKANQEENERIKKLPSLREFMKTEEFLRLGTKARIPVAVNMNGYEFKVYVRALSRNEIQACRVQAQHTDDDMDFLAVLKACTDEDGVPYDRETLEQLGYAIIRDISEAIGIASGESPSNLESNIRKKAIDNFLQKIEDET